VLVDIMGFDISASAFDQTALGAFDITIYMEDLHL